MRIALIGADGQLGSDLLVEFKENQQLFPLYFPEFDITKPKIVRSSLGKIQPDIVINTAAFNRVDDCELDPVPAFNVNAFAVRDLALVCRELDCVLVHFSTDYVFDGKKEKPYTEDDSPNPLSVYGTSKLTGEYFVQNCLQKYFIIRTCGLYGVAGCWGKGKNFVDAMVVLEEKREKIRVVDDQKVTPTWTFELAQRVKELIQYKHFGLFHLTNEGECTWFEFAKAVFSLLNKQPQLQAVNSHELGAKATRPAYSVLENKKAKEIGLEPFSHWRTALERYLAQKNLASLEISSL